jgi:hypothetical protein
MILKNIVLRLMPAFCLAAAVSVSAITEGYANKQSVFPGEQISFHVSTLAPSFTFEVYRRGATMERVATITNTGGGAFTGHNYYQSGQNYPVNGCNWPVAYTLTVPSGWKSGLYVVRIVAPSDTDRVRMNYSTRYYQDRLLKNRIIFVVKPSAPGVNSKVLMCLAFNTYQAYNGWGGSSYYYSPSVVTTVSFLRPYGDFDGYNQCCTDWDYKFIQWAEAEGYTIDYCVDSDLDWDQNLSRNFVNQYKLIVVNGHSEYWSRGMHDCVINFQNQTGGNVFFCTGNTATPDVSYSSGYTKMTKGSGGWGVSFMGGRMQGNLYSPKRYTHYPTQYGFGGMTVSTVGETSWVFAGTNLSAGEQFGRLSRLVGYESDGVNFTRSGFNFIPSESVPSGLRILAANTYSGGDKPGCKGADWQISATFVIFRRGQGTFVHEGNVNWSYGLTGDSGPSDTDPGRGCESTYLMLPDTNVQIITRNILERLGNAVRVERAGPGTHFPSGYLELRPNPFHTGVVVSWGNLSANTVETGFKPISTVSGGKLAIYNMHGRLVRALLVKNQAGHAFWDGCDALGRSLPSGQYLVRLRLGDFRAGKRVVLMR